jgi:nitroreductase
VIIDDAELLGKIGDWSGHVVLETAPALVAVLTKPVVRGKELNISVECLIADLAAATLSACLAATALGYCCGWLDSPFTDDDLQSKVAEALDLPEDRLLLLVVPVGYPGEPGPRREKKPFAERASINTYAVER